MQKERFDPTSFFRVRRFENLARQFLEVETFATDSNSLLRSFSDLAIPRHESDLLIRCVSSEMRRDFDDFAQLDSADKDECRYILEITSNRCRYESSREVKEIRFRNYFTRSANLRTEPNSALSCRMAARVSGVERTSLGPDPSRQSFKGVEKEGGAVRRSSNRRKA